MANCWRCSCGGLRDVSVRLPPEVPKVYIQDSGHPARTRPDMHGAPPPLQRGRGVSFPWVNCRRHCIA